MGDLGPFLPTAVLNITAYAVGFSLLWYRMAQAEKRAEKNENASNERFLTLERKLDNLESVIPTYRIDHLEAEINRLRDNIHALKTEVAGLTLLIWAERGGKPKEPDVG